MPGSDVPYARWLGVRLPIPVHLCGRLVLSEGGPSLGGAIQVHVRVGTHPATYPTILNNAVPDVERMAFAKNAHHVNKGIVRLLIKRDIEVDSLRRQRWPALKNVPR